MQGLRLRRLSVPGWNTVYPTPVSCSDHRTSPVLVGGMVEQPADIVNKQRIELICDLFLIGEV